MKRKGEQMKTVKLVAFRRRQPDLCKGCIWGEWTGTKQFCGRVICQRKENEGKEMVQDEQSIRVVR
jgi:hypothetical protein